MNVPDLRSPTAQRLPDADLARVISNGKDGMHSFKDSLSEEQVRDLVAYVRFLHHGK